MDDKEAVATIELMKRAGRELWFDYHNGRVMKVTLGLPNLRTDLYDRDNGENAAETAILEEFTRPDGN